MVSQLGRLQQWSVTSIEVEEVSSVELRVSVDLAAWSVNRLAGTRLAALSEDVIRNGLNSLHDAAAYHTASQRARMRGRWPVCNDRRCPLFSGMVLRHAPTCP
jgi:hypothetical protein